MIAEHQFAEGFEQEMEKLQIATKRICDIIISLLALVLLSPLLLVVSILVKHDSPGPAVFRQERLGKDGNTFTFYKFRTMYVDSSIGNLKAPEKGDSRVTKIGEVLRSTSIDELPQFLNVLQGNLSIIGPRAVPPKEIELRVQKMLLECPGHEETYRSYMKIRESIKPGITGMAQAYGRSSLSSIDSAKLDVFYVQHFSLWLDMKIFFKTIETVVLKRGVN